MEPVVSIIELDRKNAQFWEDQGLAMERRMANAAILKVAVNTINSGTGWPYPTYIQKSFEQALAEAEAAAIIIAAHVTSEFARKGGKAEKDDALQKLIIEIVQKTPEISTRQLAIELEKLKGLGVIDDIDEDAIVFTNGARCKTASFSGLKDRLSRARKKMRAR